VLGVLAGIVGTWQASEALKLLLGIGSPLAGRLLSIDALGARTREFAIPRDPACALCGPRATLHDVVTHAEPPAESSGLPELEASELDAFLERNPAALVLDVRERHEAVLGLLAGSLHVPASELEARLHELDSAATYVVACRAGAKSHWAAARLADAGFRRIVHLRDGLLAYAAAEEAFDSI
jgi:adenylyltransferase/sulfurtransferase